MPLLPHFRACNLLVLLFITGFLAACANKDLEIWRQVPIQMARVTQTESYRQTFLISTPAIRAKDKPEKDRALDERMDAIFTSMMGAENWQHLKNLYGISSVRNELMAGQIHMDGLINFTVYLDPTDLDYIVLEGSGRYFAIRDKTEAILMSGDYHVPPQRYSIDSLSTGCLPLDIKLYITRIPGKTTYYKNIVVRYDLIIDTSNASEKAYSVNYMADHYAFLDLNKNGRYEADDELIGVLKMNDQLHQAKLFDIRGLLFIKQNYKISQEAKLATAISTKHDARQCVKYKPLSKPVTHTGEG